VVRDAVMGRPSHDVDLTVAADAIPFTFRLADALGWPAYALDDERDVGRILAPDEDTTLDVARFRGETLEDDLRGRDFTINALALPAMGERIDDVIDLHGGLADIAAGRVRVIHERSIADDPLRALRAARLAVQLEFDLTEETTAAARAAGPLLPERASPERIRDEIGRILTTNAPHLGMALLWELDLLSIVLPEIAALDGLAQSSPHREDVLPHTLSVLRHVAAVENVVDGISVTGDWVAEVEHLIAPYRDQLRAYLDRPVDGGAKGRALLRWAALFHDVGKRGTQTISDGRLRYLGHDDLGAQLTGRRLAALSFSNEAARRVRSIVGGHMRPLYLAGGQGHPSRRTIYRYFRALHEAGLDVGLLALADHLATYDGRGDPASWDALLMVVGDLYQTYFERHGQTIAPPRLLDGHAIIALLNTPPGHEIGRLLRLLEEAQAAGEIHTEAEAIAYVRKQHRTTDHGPTTATNH
jgi:putative nucleotidyltransferase with HDIG domain